MARRTATIAYEKSSSNVFADPGLPHPEQRLLKACLTREIDRVFKARRLSRALGQTVLDVRPALTLA
jgi:hypothetical protein